MATGEIRFRLLVETMAEGLLIDDLDRHIGYVNSRLCEMLGYSREELIGHRFAEFLSPCQQQILEEQWKRRTHGENPQYELAVNRRDGTPCEVLVSPQRILDVEGKLTGTFAVITDLSDLKRAEKERMLLAIAIEQAAETVVITDAQGTIQYVNPIFEETTGYSREEAIGANPRILKSGQHSEQYYRDLWSTLGAGEVWMGHFVNRHKDGSLFEEEATISPVHDGEGTTIAYVAVKRDISEERRLAKRLERAQKLEALGHLAGGLAHNFNNILMAISGTAEVLRLRMQGDDRFAGELAAIESNVARAAELTRRLLSVARQQVLEMHVLDPGELVHREVEILAKLLPESIVIDVQLADDLPAISADRDELAQILVNLVVRARDTMPDGGRITISAAAVTADAILLAAFPEARDGEYVRISVADSSAGMELEARENVFDPFFSAAASGENSGLDLASVYGMVVQHGGMIEVESRPGGGSRFDIYLPTTSERPATAAVSVEPGTAAGGETILVVEDEDAVRHALVEMVSALGYAVIEASDGRAALKEFVERSREINLVLSDVAMPEMGGRELLARVREIEPATPFVFSSGYAGAEVMDEPGSDVNAFFISKPYSTARLAAVLRKALADSTGSA